MQPDEPGSFGMKIAAMHAVMGPGSGLPTAPVNRRVTALVSLMKWTAVGIAQECCYLSMHRA